MARIWARQATRAWSIGPHSCSARASRRLQRRSADTRNGRGQGYRPGEASASASPGASMQVPINWPGARKSSRASMSSALARTPARMRSLHSGRDGPGAQSDGPGAQSKGAITGQRRRASLVMLRGAAGLSTHLPTSRGRVRPNCRDRRCRRPVPGRMATNMPT